MQELKEQFEFKLRENYDSSLGTLEEQLEYLYEEFRELDLSNKWDKLPTEKMTENPNNILLWWLMGLAEKPRGLKHGFTESESADIDCLDEKTYIKTTNGIKPINCLKNGDILFDKDGKPTEVQYIFKRRQKMVENIYELQFDDGMIVRCSENHKFLIGGQWKTAEEIHFMLKV